jgi:hypothetical protein
MNLDAIKRVLFKAVLKYRLDSLISDSYYKRIRL